MRKMIILFCVGFLLTLSNQVLGQSALEISKKAMDVIEVGDMEMISTINIYDAKGNVRTRQISTASRKFADATKMLIRFLAPADVKGTTLLVHDYEDKADNQWIYLPATRNVRRIVSTEKAKNFMGSEFTNADMSKPNLNDFSYKTLGDAEINGKKCWTIEATPKTDLVKQENGFAKRTSYIDQNTYLCYKIEYYDTAGKMYRVQTIADYKKQSNGMYFAYKMTMKNELNGRKSEMIVDKFQMGSQMSESLFSASSLDK